MAGMAAAGAVAAALFARERTGEGQLVSTSLLRIGMYMLGWDVNMSLRLGVPTVPMTVVAPPNPLISAYEAGDGKRFWMLGLQGDRHWPDVLRAVGRPEWADDERFADLMARFANSAELVRELNAIFATKPLDEWAEVFDREDVWWAPVQHAHDLIDDPIARAAGGFVSVPVDGGEPGGHGGVADRLRRHAVVAAVDAARVRAAHRGGAPRARPRLGPHHRAQGARRHPVSDVGQLAAANGTRSMAVPMRSMKLSQ